MRLHSYQLRAADFVVGNPASLLAMEVGLGKTAATLVAVQRLISEGEVVSTLVVAPKRVAEHVWMQERDLWTPDLPMRVISGSPKERLRAALDPAPVHVISRDNLVDLIDKLGPRWPYDCLILDESQGFKDSSTKRFRALRKVCKHHQRTVLLSATPASEGLMGLWSQVFLADGGKRLGKAFTAFKEAFFECDYMGWNWTPRKGAEEKIHARIADMTISMRAEDYLELPDRIDNIITINLDANDRRQYEQLERDYLLPLRDGTVTAANAAVLFGKLNQLSGGAIYDEERQVQVLHTAKIDALVELVDAANGNPVLVFYGYRHERDRILASIKGAEELNVETWNAGKQRVAVAHAASAGAGLNLQHGGHLMCWFSLPPSLELYTQACGRLHRQGQRKGVVIHHLVVAGTIDEKIIELLASKALTQNRLLEALK